VIGWLGLSSGFGYLYAIEPALREVLRNHPEARLRVVSSSPPKLQTLPVEQVEFVFFTRQHEAADIQGMTIGIMPLDDSVASRGKCSFKMLQYMACGLPAVVSPVGMNAEVLRQGEVGLGARNLREWVDGLEILLRDPDLCARMGKTGRMVVEQDYSLEVLAPRLAKILFRVVEQHRSQPLLLARKVTRTDKVNHAGELPP
jgi:glycosyltransferase involved in cell wall biosynthesis